jgi:hypothetical protein
MSRALEGLLSGLMQRTSHSKCHKTAAYVFKPLRVVDLVHQQKGCSRDAAEEGDELQLIHFNSFGCRTLGILTRSRCGGTGKLVVTWLRMGTYVNGKML